MHDLNNHHELSIMKRKRSGSNAESTLQENRSLILHIIKDAGVITRTELAARSGLTQATITIIINEFLEKEIVRKKGLIEGNRGRRITGLELNDDKFCTIAVRMNVSYIDVGIYDLYSKCIKVIKLFMNTFDDLSATCNKIYSVINDLRPFSGDKEVLGIGVGVEGPFILKNNRYVINNNSEHNLFDIGEELMRITSFFVSVNKSNNFGAYYLWNKFKSENKDLETLISIAVSYTIECGILSDGQIFNGSLGLAGLLGDVVLCVDKDGSLLNLNDSISSAAVLSKVNELLDKYPESSLHAKRGSLNIRDVISAFYTNDALAIRVYSDVGKLLGLSIANIINLLNPDWIVIGDELPNSDDMLDFIKQEIKNHVLPEAMEETNIIIVKSERRTENDITLMGASMFVTDIALSMMEFSKKG